MHQVLSGEGNFPEPLVVQRVIQVSKWMFQESVIGAVEERGAAALLCKYRGRTLLQEATGEEVGKTQGRVPEGMEFSTVA